MTELYWWLSFSVGIHWGLIVGLMIRMHNLRADLESERQERIRVTDAHHLRLRIGEL